MEFYVANHVDMVVSDTGPVLEAEPFSLGSKLSDFLASLDDGCVRLVCLFDDDSAFVVERDIVPVSNVIRVDFSLRREENEDNE